MINSRMKSRRPIGVFREPAARGRKVVGGKGFEFRGQVALGKSRLKREKRGEKQ